MYRRREPLEKSAVLEIELHFLYFTALLSPEKATICLAPKRHRASSIYSR